MNLTLINSLLNMHDTARLLCKVQNLQLFDDQSKNVIMHVYQSKNEFDTYQLSFI